MKDKFIFPSVFVIFSLIFWCSFSPDTQSVTHTVVIKNMKFEPSELLVKKGDSVKFINQDLVIHNITEENKRWASPSIAPESSWSCVVKEKVNYYCSFHPIMKGKLLVKEK